MLMVKCLSQSVLKEMETAAAGWNEFERKLGICYSTRQNSKDHMTQQDSVVIDHHPQLSTFGISSGVS